MRSFKFLLSLAATVGILWIFNHRFEVSGKKIPALGQFMNPVEGFWANAEAAKDQKNSEKLNLPGLKAEVKVIYDDRLVPHIFAENAEDAALVQGYLTAKHRLWQMEFYTHAAAGRLTEITGNSTLRADQQTRRLGLPFAAKNALEEWKKAPDYFKYIEAYAKGVNEYIDNLSPSDYPIEYKLLSYSPELWTPYKSALLLKMMARTLASREDDLESSNALAMLGKGEFNHLFPEWFDEQSPIIPKGTIWDFKKVETPGDSTSFIGEFSPGKDPFFEKPQPFLGSNNWAVDGSKTKSGNAILCNDPHLGLTLPSIWFEVQVKVPEYNAYGVSLPGIPGIIIGFNENIAWGMTNVGHDVSDWYRITWKDTSRDEYLLDGKYVKSDQVIEEYKLKDGASVYDTIYYTVWGPVGYTKEGQPYKDLAFRWLAHDPSMEMKIFYDLNKAKNYDEYRAAISAYACPAQNVVFASREGDIAITVQGKFPIKTNQQGRFIQDGSLTANAWHGFIPVEQIPYMKNPERGFVSSANQHSTDPTYPYYYNAGFADYRGRALNSFLSDLSDISVEDMQKLQNNNFNLRAKEFLPLVLPFLEGANLTESESSFANELGEWDYYHEKEWIAPSVYSAWFQEFYRMLWDEFYAWGTSSEILYPEAWRTIFLLRDESDSKWFDVASTETVEGSGEIALASFREACKKLEIWSTEQGKAPDWRDYKNTEIGHLGRVSAFSSKNVDVGGYRYALNAVGRDHGPSWRMVVEMSNPVKAWAVYPGGQSGNPGSPHYDDFLAPWAKGEYFELLFLKGSDDINDRLGSEIVCSPKSN